MLLEDILLPKNTCKSFYTFGCEIKDENVEDTGYHIYLLSSASTRKKAFQKMCIGVLKDAENSLAGFTQGKKILGVSPDNQHHKSSH